MWPIIGNVLVIVFNAYFLKIGIKHLKHNTRGIELFEEGCRIYHEEGALLDDDQREELLRRIHGLMKHRRYAIFDTVMLVINMVCIMAMAYFLAGRLGCF
jgi:hypothetical protein